MGCCNHGNRELDCLLFTAPILLGTGTVRDNKERDCLYWNQEEHSHLRHNYIHCHTGNKHAQGTMLRQTIDTTTWYLWTRVMHNNRITAYALTFLGLNFCKLPVFAIFTVCVITAHHCPSGKNFHRTKFLWMATDP